MRYKDNYQTQEHIIVLMIDPKGVRIEIGVYVGPGDEISFDDPYACDEDRELTFEEYAWLEKPEIEQEVVDRARDQAWASSY